MQPKMHNSNSPDDRGYFGDYGGRFVPDTLMAPLLQLEQAYAEAATELRGLLNA